MTTRASIDEICCKTISWFEQVCRYCAQTCIFVWHCCPFAAIVRYMFEIIQICSLFLYYYKIIFSKMSQKIPCWVGQLSDCPRLSEIDGSLGRKTIINCSPICLLCIRNYDLLTLLMSPTCFVCLIFADNPSHLSCLLSLSVKFVQADNYRGRHPAGIWLLDCPIGRDDFNFSTWILSASSHIVPVTERITLDFNGMGVGGLLYPSRELPMWRNYFEIALARGCIFWCIVPS